MGKSQAPAKRALWALLIPLCWGPAYTRAQPWPDIFDPTLFQTLNLQMDPFDWTTVQADTTFLIEDIRVETC